VSGEDFVRYGFTAHRNAVDDLDQLPRPVRAAALLLLHEVMQGRVSGIPLEAHEGRDLSDCRKVYVDKHSDWRLVYRDTPTAWNSPVERDIVLIAAGRRDDLAVYRTAARRLGREDGKTPLAANATTAAARSRSTLVPPAGSGPVPAAPAAATPRPVPARSR